MQVIIKPINTKNVSDLPIGVIFTTTDPEHIGMMFVATDEYANDNASLRRCLVLDGGEHYRAGLIFNIQCNTQATVLGELVGAI